ncbi:unnamed protein product [Ixodes persulcatus]
MILASMNHTEDPCTDFYEYACGNWKKTHEIPDDQTKFGNFHILIDKVEMDVKDILLNATLEEKEPQNATNKAILAYRVCLCETVNETEKFNDLLKLLQEGGFTEWPLLNKEESPYEDYTLLLNQSTFLPFVSFSVFQDAKNIDSNVIYLDQISFDWVGRNELINQTTKASMKIVAAYKKLIQSTAKVFRPHLTDDEAQILSEDILRFEATLAKLSKAEEDRRNFSSMYNEMNISTLSQTYPKIEWLNLFNYIFALANMTLDEDERVIVSEPDYVQGIEQILEGENVLTLYNFVFWTWIRTYGAVASTQLDKLFFDFYKEASGVKKDEPLWKKCLTRISDLITHAIGRLYVDKMFDPKAKKTEDLLLKTLAASPQTGWTGSADDDETEPRLNPLNLNLTPTKLHSVLVWVSTSKPRTTHHESFSSLSHRGVAPNRARSPKILTNTIYLVLHWLFLVNTEVKHTTYISAFPAGILQPPFFQDDVPSSINMGAIGMVIGHEITHGFDDSGDQFDGDGQLRDWWTETAQKEFSRRAECFIEQYSNVTVKEVNLTLNGVNTQGENIADNSGLRAAYLAFKKFNDTDLVLPRLNLTGDQLFFLSNAMVWCQKIREERLRIDVQYDPHSPAKYR